MYASARQAVIVGIVLTVALLALMYLALRIQGPKVSKESYLLNAQFDKVSGLEIGNPVAVAGVNVGAVLEISYDSQLGKVRVVMAVRKVDKIPKDSVRPFAPGACWDLTIWTLRLVNLVRDIIRMGMKS